MTKTSPAFLIGRTHIFFDFDDTIVRAKEKLVPLWESVLSDFGERVDTRILEQKIRGRPAKLAIAELFPSWPSARLEQFLVHLEKNEETMEYGIVAGADDCIRDLYAGGYSLSIVTTSWTKKVEYALNRFGLLHCFKNLVTRELVSRQKPDPEPYLRAYQMSGAPSPASCIALEDSPTGVASAKAAGIYCVGLFDASLLAAGADVTVSSFREFCS